MEAGVRFGRYEIVRFLGAGGMGEVDFEATTRAFASTDPGSVMGTVNYMSPEQGARRTALAVRIVIPLKGKKREDGKEDSYADR